MEDRFDAALNERLKSSGDRSAAESLVGLVEVGYAVGVLEIVLAERTSGPFVPMESD